MRVGVMVTNNGSHPPEKWAAESASQIVDVIQIDPNSIAFNEMNNEKTKLGELIKTALAKHHSTNQKLEVYAIEEKEFDQFDATTDPDEDVLGEAIVTVQECAAQTLFASHFQKPEVVKFVRSTLGSHFATVKQIERSQFADKHINHPKAKAFKEHQG